MAQFLEFVADQWLLSTLWVLLLAAFLLHRSKTGSRAVSTQEAVMLINRKDGVVLDIRDKKEFDAGHIVDAINIPATKLAARITELEKYRSRPLIVVCKLGQHSTESCNALTKAGFEQVVKLRGGMTEWRGQNLPVTQK